MISQRGLDRLRSGWPIWLPVSDPSTAGSGERLAGWQASVRLTPSGLASARDDRPWHALRARLSSELDAALREIVGIAHRRVRVEPPFEISFADAYPLLNHTVEVLGLRVGSGGPELTADAAWRISRADRAGARPPESSSPPPDTPDRFRRRPDNVGQQIPGPWYRGQQVQGLRPSGQENWAHQNSELRNWMQQNWAQVQQNWGQRNAPSDRSRLQWRGAGGKRGAADRFFPVPPTRQGLPTPQAHPDSGSGSVASSAAERRLQCRIGPAHPHAIQDNLLRSGTNWVTAFVGIARPHTLMAGAIPERRVVYHHGKASLTVQLTPVEPVLGTPSTATLTLPRNGDSTLATLKWLIPEDTTRATAQIMLRQGPVVLALAELTGDVGGPAGLVNPQAMGSPDSWHASSPVGSSIVLYTEPDGRQVLVHPRSAQVSLLPDLTQLGEELCAALGMAPALRGTRPKALTRAELRILIDVARIGARLRNMVGPLLGEWADPTHTHLQVITGGAPINLPLELAYELPTPRDDAKVCPTWVAGGECGPNCGGDDPRAIICPAAFWGISRVIERHYWARRRDTAWLCEPAPSPHDTLTLEGTLLAASHKVEPGMLKRAALDEIPLCSTWDDWRTSLATPPDEGLLLLLPHVDHHALEVSATWLEEGDVKPPYVVGEDPGKHPLMVLFGCETAGSPSDLYGVATYFLGAGAANVLGTLASVNAEVAAQLAAIVLRVLRGPHAAGRPIGEVVTEVRRAALRQNIVTALALTAYGDSRWEV